MNNNIYLLTLYPSKMGQSVSYNGGNLGLDFDNQLFRSKSPLVDSYGLAFWFTGEGGPPQVNDEVNIYYDLGGRGRTFLSLSGAVSVKPETSASPLFPSRARCPCCLPAGGCFIRLCLEAEAYLRRTRSLAQLRIATAGWRWAHKGGRTGPALSTPPGRPPGACALLPA
jgi:hypothetical protein